MYLFYIKKTSTTQEVYSPYTEEGEIFSTDNLTVLASKYKDLIKKYTTEQIKIVQELSPEIIVTITD